MTFALVAGATFVLGALGTGGFRAVFDLAVASSSARFWLALCCSSVGNLSFMLIFFMPFVNSSILSTFVVAVELVVAAPDLLGSSSAPGRLVGTAAAFLRGLLAAEADFLVGARVFLIGKAVSGFDGAAEPTLEDARALNESSFSLSCKSCRPESTLEAALERRRVLDGWRADGSGNSLAAAIVVRRLLALGTA